MAVNPIVQFIERHPRAEWATGALMNAYIATHGAPPPGAWASALGQAYQRERVQQAIAYGNRNMLLRNVLRGVLAAGDNVVVRVRVRGLDPMGTEVDRVVMDVHVSTADRLRDVHAQIMQQITMDAAVNYGFTATDYDVLPGSWSY